MVFGAFPPQHNFSFPALADVRIGYHTIMQFQSEYVTKVFSNLPPEKQKTIFNAAAAEFARHGYDRANTNAIARRAGISVGSLFQYFGTKPAIFNALVDFGTQTALAPALANAPASPDMLSLFRYMLEKAREFALQYPDYNRVYLELTTQMPVPASKELARRIEGRTIISYRRALRKAQKENDVQAGCAAFLLDNLVLAYQFSFASDYYRDRIVAYTGLDPLKDGDALCDALCALVRDLAGIT